MSGHAAQHAHAHHVHAHDLPRASGARLRLAFGITLGVLLVEVAGGLLTGSVALLADAGHMLADAFALGIAFLAARLATRPRTTRMTFGYGRVEIVAALGNGFLLGGVSVGVALEAVERLQAPPVVAAAPMIAIAAVGLGANLLCAAILREPGRANLNVRAAYLHVLGDALGSLAALSAGAVMLSGGPFSADALAALAIAALLVVSALRLVREALDVLLERTPRHLDPVEIEREACAIPGVVSIHDLHIWTVASGFLAMSAHVDLARGASAEDVRRAVHRLLHQRYDIRHTTIQTEEAPRLLEIESSPRGVPEPESSRS